MPETYRDVNDFQVPVVYSNECVELNEIQLFELTHTPLVRLKDVRAFELTPNYHASHAKTFGMKTSASAGVEIVARYRIGEGVDAPLARVIIKRIMDDVEAEQNKALRAEAELEIIRLEARAKEIRALNSLPPKK